MNELRTGIACLNDLSERRKPRTEEKYPQLLVDLRTIMDPESQAESHLRTSFSYTNMTADAVRSALLEKGWSNETIPITQNREMRLAVNLVRKSEVAL